MVDVVGERVGVLADRPEGARRVGARYFATDDGLLGAEYEWNGVAWLPVPSSPGDAAIFLRPQDFQAGTGAARATNFLHEWVFDNDANEDIQGGTFIRPPHWEAIDVELIWYAFALGDVRWRVTVQGVSVGESGIGFGFSEESTVDLPVPSPDDETVGRDTIVSGLAVTKQLHGLVVQRRGADAEDTSTNQALLLGVIVRQAT